MKHLTYLLLGCLVLFSVKLTNAQGYSEYRSPTMIAFTNHSTMLPGNGALGLITTPIHPGIKLGSYRSYLMNEDHHLYQTIWFSYFYHPKWQHGLKLTTEVAYRKTFLERFQGGLNIGAGYFHSFPLYETFEMDDDGNYVETGKYGRSYFTTDVTLGLNYLLGEIGRDKNSLRIFLEQTLWLQMPFVKQYVPILPNTQLALGLSIDFTPTGNVIKKKIR